MICLLIIIIILIFSLGVLLSGVVEVLEEIRTELRLRR